MSEAIDDLIKSSEHDKLERFPGSELTAITPTPRDTVYYGMFKYAVTLVFIESSEKCTPTSVSAFARIYSLPTCKYDKDDNNFKRYSKWLKQRNELILGFTE